MRYQNKSSIAYLFRNFWRLAPMCFGVAILAGFFLNDAALLNFSEDFSKGFISSHNIIWRLFYSVTVLRFGKYWWCTLIAVVSFALAESMLMVKVARHMHVGEMPLFPFKRAIRVFPIVLLFVVCVMCLSEVCNLAVVGVAYIMRSAGVIPVVVVSAVLHFAFRVVAMMCVGMLIFAFPIMFVENYSYNSALSYSVRLVSERRKFLFAVAFSYPVAQILVISVCGLIDIYAVTITLYSVFHLFCILLLPCIAFRQYYDSVGGERRDIAYKIFD